MHQIEKTHISLLADRIHDLTGRISWNAWDIPRDILSRQAISRPGSTTNTFESSSRIRRRNRLPSPLIRCPGRLNKISVPYKQVTNQRTPQTDMRFEELALEILILFPHNWKNWHIAPVWCYRSFQMQYKYEFANHRRRRSEDAGSYRQERKQNSNSPHVE